MGVFSWQSLTLDTLFVPYFGALWNLSVWAFPSWKIWRIEYGITVNFIFFIIDLFYKLFYNKIFFFFPWGFWIFNLIWANLLWRWSKKWKFLVIFLLMFRINWIAKSGIFLEWSITRILSYIFKKIVNRYFGYIEWRWIR